MLLGLIITYFYIPDVKDAEADGKIKSLERLTEELFLDDGGLGERRGCFPCRRA